MHFGGSFVGKASTTGIEISPTPSLIFTGVGVKNCEIWCRFLHHSTLSRSRLKMQQDIRTLKQTSCVKMIALCPRQVWWSWVFAPRESYVSCAPPPKIARRKKRAKSSITKPWSTRFHSDCVQSLSVWHSKCCKNSRSRGQRPMSQRNWKVAIANALQLQAADATPVLFSVRYMSSPVRLSVCMYVCRLQRSRALFRRLKFSAMFLRSLVPWPFGKKFTEIDPG